MEVIRQQPERHLAFYILKKKKEFSKEEKFSSVHVLQEVWHIKQVSLQLLLLNSSAKLRIISPGFLPLHPETGCAALATTALTVAGRHSHILGSWHLQGVLLFKAKPSLRKVSPFCGTWTAMEHFGKAAKGVKEDTQVLAWGCPRSTCILQGTVWSCWGACGSQCPLETSQKHCGRGERAPHTKWRHQSSFPSSFPETETTITTQRPMPCCSALHESYPGWQKTPQKCPCLPCVGKVGAVGKDRRRIFTHSLHNQKGSNRCNFLC